MSVMNIVTACIVILIMAVLSVVAIRFLVTDDLIRKAVQTSFNAAKSGLEVLKNA